MLFRKKQVEVEDPDPRDRILKDNSEEIYSRIVEKFETLNWKHTGGNGYFAYPNMESEVRIYLWNTGYWTMQVDTDEVAKGKDTEGLYKKIIKRKVERAFE